PLPSARVETRPFGPVGGRCRDFLKQVGKDEHLALHPHPSGIRSMFVLTCGALAVSSFGSHRCSFPSVTDTSTPQDDGSLLHPPPKPLPTLLFLPRGSQSCD
ncbi:hypothetical protein, partial [Rhizobium ruizarguesonis]|uniref:hypothetical protein n=1 Tax=Rhizobium ruizarguesonis TaxID=2081791 RepID=UPI00195469C3